MLPVAGLTLFALLVFFTFLFGGLYATRTTYMPHHAQAAGKRWEELDPRMQHLARTYVNALGFGCIAVSVLGAGLLAAHLEQPSKLLITTLSAGLVLHWCAIGLVAWRLARATGAPTRWRGGFLLALLTLLAAALVW